jgi:tetratricopeptide (TPR) repeat protein
LAIILG